MKSRLILDVEFDDSSDTKQVSDVLYEVANAAVNAAPHKPVSLSISVVPEVPSPSARGGKVISVTYFWIMTLLITLALVVLWIKLIARAVRHTNEWVASFTKNIKR